MAKDCFKILAVFLLFLSLIACGGGGSGGDGDSTSNMENAGNPEGKNISGVWEMYSNKDASPEVAQPKEYWNFTDNGNGTLTMVFCGITTRVVKSATFNGTKLAITWSENAETITATGGVTSTFVTMAGTWQRSPSGETGTWEGLHTDKTSCN